MTSFNRDQHTLSEVVTAVRGWFHSAVGAGGDSGSCRLIYKLRHWPQLPPGMTAEVYRTLSVMSQRPVNRSWILRSSKLKPRQVDSLLQWLVDHDAVEIVDSAAFAPTIAMR